MTAINSVILRLTTVLCALCVLSQSLEIKRSMKSRDGQVISNYMNNKHHTPIQDSDSYGSVYDFNYRARNGLDDGYSQISFKQPSGKRSSNFNELLAKLGELSGNQDLVGYRAKPFRFGHGRR